MNLFNPCRLIFIVLIIALVSCSETETPQPKESENNYPDSQFDDAVILLSQDGRQSIKVLADHIDRWEKNDSTEAINIEVIFYDTLGTVRSTLKAIRGLIREKSEEIAMYGDVVGVSEKGTKLNTQSLFYNPDSSLIFTDDYVEIEEADGSILTGYGLRTDPNLKNIEILRDVSGQVIGVSEPDKEKQQNK